MPPLSVKLPRSVDAMIKIPFMDNVIHYHEELSETRLLLATTQALNRQSFLLSTRPIGYRVLQMIHNENYLSSIIFQKPI